MIARIQALLDRLRNSAVAKASQASAQQDYLDGYVDRAEATLLLLPPRRSRVLLWTLSAFVVYALVWSAFAELDEITRGLGRVIPSQQLQVIQNLEGGILQQIYVREGDDVSRGQSLLKIDDTRFRSALQEQRQAMLFLLAGIARLEAEIGSVTIGETALSADNWRDQLEVVPQPILFGAELERDQSGIRAQAQAQYLDRLRNVGNQLSIIERGIEQKMQGKLELESKVRHLVIRYELALEEMALTEPLAEQGVVPRIELLQLRREVNRQKSELDSSQLLLPRVQSEIMQAIYERRDVALKFRAEIQNNLSEIQAQLARQNETRIGLEDRVERTLVVSPVQGTVKRIAINTVGGIIQPGMDLLEIVPTEEQLLIEARVLVKDIAFLRPGLEAVVRFTAYDFAIYGGLKGRVDHISADSIEDEKGELYYLVRVSTEPSEVAGAASALAIIPGMMATIDIVTGQKSVLDYLLKPILRAKQRALTER